MSDSNTVRALQDMELKIRTLREELRSLEQKYMVQYRDLEELKSRVQRLERK